ncbi:hypothetical protein EN879_05540, partial [Mesorhizobium sp. M7A.F.Ca.AU.002.02.1.1]
MTSDHAVERPAIPAPTTITFIKSDFPQPVGWLNVLDCGRQHTVWNQAGKPRYWSGMSKLTPPAPV